MREPVFANVDEAVIVGAAIPILEAMQAARGQFRVHWAMWRAYLAVSAARSAISAVKGGERAPKNAARVAKSAARAADPHGILDEQEAADAVLAARNDFDYLFRTFGEHHVVALGDPINISGGEFGA